MFLRPKEDLLIETIKIWNNRILNLGYHQERISKSLFSIYGCNNVPMDIDRIKNEVEQLNIEAHKLRIIYSPTYFEYDIESYQLKKIESLHLVKSDLSYNFKFLDRNGLDELFTLRGVADDILIVRDGFLTDTYYCNIALRKNHKWYTPEVPLLYGTKRQQLLDDEIIQSVPIRPTDIKNYEAIRLFNAMIEFGEIEISTCAII